MKKRVEKSKTKPAAAKPVEARKASPLTAASPHDPLHNLLRGAHAHKLCGPRPS